MIKATFLEGLAAGLVIVAGSELVRQLEVQSVEVTAAIERDTTRRVLFDATSPPRHPCPGLQFIAQRGDDPLDQWALECVRADLRTSALGRETPCADQKPAARAGAYPAPALELGVNATASACGAKAARGGPSTPEVK